MLLAEYIFILRKITCRRVEYNSLLSNIDKTEQNIITYFTNEMFFTNEV